MIKMMWMLPFILMAAAQTSPISPSLSLTTDKTTYRSGEPVEMTLSVSNSSGQLVKLHFDTSQRYDFLIQDAADQQMWSWAQDRMFLQVVRREEIAPGGTHVFKERFFGMLPAGSYHVTARLTAREATTPVVASFAIE